MKYLELMVGQLVKHPQTRLLLQDLNIWSLNFDLVLKLDFVVCVVLKKILTK